MKKQPQEQDTGVELSESEIDEQIEELLAKKKQLTLMKGKGVEEGQDGNVGQASAVTGEVDYEKQAKMKMLKKMLQG